MYVATGERSALANPTARALYDHLRHWEQELDLTDASVFFDFPLYRDEERLVQCQFLLASASCGIVLAGVSNAQRDAINAMKKAESAVDSAFGQLMARLIKNPKLRRGKAELQIPFDAFLFAPDLDPTERIALETFEVVRNEHELHEFFRNAKRQRLPEATFAEALATIEGAKGLIRPKERDIVPFPANSKAALAAALEEEINRFDRDQTDGYLQHVDGVQRIRGLAGSGKTVVLAMRAALLHLRNPDARIAFTFYTKSLYQHVRRLITRFYRQYDDVDPNWEKIHVLHAWGGRSNPGIYSNACLNNGIRPLTYSEAPATPGRSPFEAVCSLLLSSTKVQPEYDYVLVDEAQDFPPSFLLLCYSLARDGKLVFAYDQLQTIFQARPPTMDEIFGTDELGDALVELQADTVLHKCYRNPLEITVCAHALGFGLYGDRIVQMLENEEHWKDLGYQVLNGPFRPGAETQIQRIPASSPSSISARCTADEIISTSVYAHVTEEVEAVASQIEACIREQGLRPDDILIVAANDRNARTYLSSISAALRRRRIDTNNLHADRYSIQDFVRENSVTLSTIHKAKGNEAYQVFVVGIDALFNPINLRSQNMVFVAMTRAKAWLHVTGVGQFAEVFKRELDEAKRRLPNLEFRYPTEQDFQIMQRDLRETPEQRAEQMLRELRELLPEEDVRRLLQQQLDLKEPTRSPKRGPRRDRRS